MVRFLIHRPIAVLLSVVGILAFSVLALFELPLSLLPDIEVPSIIIRTNYPNTPPAIIENSILKPIRNEMNSLNKLKGMESMASSETGQITLRFDFGTRMDLTYIEINEKIDRLQEVLPRDLDRPLVARINTSDIPVIRLQLIPKNQDNFIAISELTEKVIKKRIEQLAGVSVVDINGSRQRFIAIEPDAAKLQALGISEAQMEQVLKSANQELGQLSIQDGQYRYFVRMTNRLDDLNEIRSLPLTNKEGIPIALERLATVEYKTQKVLSYHVFNGKEGLVITIHKQASAKMNELMPMVYKAVEQFSIDYPEIDFELTQDQSLLLNAGINNLKSSLLFGGLFAFLVLFLFMGDFRLPLLMGITLPISLTISFLFFYAFGISINIISLSGLALGLGMLIDNSIIVIDNITRIRKEGKSLIEACVQGVNEVMAPLISSVLTTLAVFVPLVFLNGLSDALFKDQAISVAIILAVSLMVSFIVLPLIYRLFFQGRGKKVKEDSFLFRFILKGYKGLFSWVFRFKKMSFALLLLLIPSAYFLIDSMDKAGLPVMEKTETLITVNWNEPILASTNKERIIDFTNGIDELIDSEADVGIRQFLLEGSGSTLDQAQVYLKYSTSAEKQKGSTWAKAYFARNFPTATLQIEDAPNAFDQLFARSKAQFIAKWKNLGRNEPLDQTALSALESIVLTVSPDVSPGRGKGFLWEETVTAAINPNTMVAYGISESALKAALSKALDGYLVTDIRRFGEVTPLRITRDTSDFQHKLRSVETPSPNGQSYPLSTFIDLSISSDHKHVTADRSGVYQSMEWENLDNATILALRNTLPVQASQRGLTVDFDGDFFENQENLRQLIFILSISIALLYFILAAQFESLVQPLIVIFTLPLGITGALLVLRLTGSTFNVMSAIGIIVMLGIMVNDAILKIDTINRLKVNGLRLTKKPSAEIRRQTILQAISKTGEIRLKPILMTSITTILALLPVAFSSGLGADLQRPLVYAVIGGLTIGTFTALFFVPLAYWFMCKK